MAKLYLIHGAGVPGAGIDGSGGDGHDGGMEERLKRLEAIAVKTDDRLRAIETDVAVIKSNYSTKADLSDAKNSIIMWVISAIFLAQLIPALPGLLRALKLI